MGLLTSTGLGLRGLPLLLAAPDTHGCTINAVAISDERS